MKESKLIRKKWFKILKIFLKPFIRKTKFVFLDKKLNGPYIIVSNHSAASGPLGYEFHYEDPFRFWGTYEMNSGLVSCYKYLSNNYYPKKKHWNKFLSKVFCLIAAPVCNVFYKGLNLISTYPDTRFRKTLKESVKTLTSGNNLIVFPEASENGYFKELTCFHEGFVVFLEYCRKHNIDVPVYIAYFDKDKKTCYLDKPVYINELLSMNLSRFELSKYLCDKCNKLGKYNL